MLFIKKDSLTLQALNALRRLAAFANADYYRALAMHQSLYRISRIIYEGDDGEQYLGLPRGCKAALIDLLEHNGARYTLSDERTCEKHIDVEFRGELRPEQLDAANVLLEHDTGVLSAATGFGKTVIGAYLIAARKVPTLVLVPSTTLLDQWIESLEQFLVINEQLPPLFTKTGRKSSKKRSLVGRIGGGKNVPSGIIDVAIPSSLFEKGDVACEKRVKESVRSYGQIICDECHHVASTQYKQVTSYSSARFVTGMTATPMRKDELDPIIFMQCGPLRHTFSGKDQSAIQSFNRILVPRFTRFRLGEGDQDRSFASLLELVCQDSDRNHLIVQDAIALVSERRTPLILTKLVNHATCLHDLLLAKGIDSLLLTGEGSNKEKAERIAQLRDQDATKPFAVVGTGNYIGEGFDDDRFDALLLAAPVSWKGLVAQYAGRLHREREGKRDVLVYDYMDVHVSMFEGMYRKRLKEYGALGYEACIPETEGRSSAFFSGNNHLQQLVEDIERAEHTIIIHSSYANLKKIELLADALHAATTRNVAVTITLASVAPSSNYHNAYLDSSTKLQALGCTMVESIERLSNLAIIDKEVVWYGEINLLSFNKTDACSIRFESAAVAHELTENG